MNLINNGLDSFEKAFQKLCSMDEKDSDQAEYVLKDIVLEFHHSFEVLFKAVLNRKNPALLYADIDKYYDMKFNASVNPDLKQPQGVQTITFMQAFKRIVVSDQIKIDRFCYQNMMKFNDLRNSLTHSETKMELKQLRILIANILFNILPILESVSEFKEYIEEKSVSDNLRKISFIRDEWMLHHIIYLLNYKNQSESEPSETLKYKKLLHEIGYMESMKTDPNDRSEKEFILTRFEFELYGYGTLISDREIAYDNPYMMELIAAQVDVIESATNEIIKEKITNNLAVLLSSCDGIICDFTDRNFKEIQQLYKKLKSHKKLRMGLIIQRIGHILKQWEVFTNKDSRNKKIANILTLYSFQKTCILNRNFYQQAENGNYKFTLTYKEYLKIMGALFQDDKLLFSLDSQFDQYVTAKVADSVESYLNNDTWDFFWENLMGSFGEWGSVDNISEINCYGIDAVCDVVNRSEFTIWSEMEIGTEYYSDHEYYSDGSRYLCISLNVKIDENEEIHLSELQILD